MTTLEDEIDIDPTILDDQPGSHQSNVQNDDDLDGYKPASKLEAILLTISGATARHLEQEKSKEPGLMALTKKLRTFSPNVIKEAIDESTLNHLLQAQDNILQKSKVGHYRQITPPTYGTDQVLSKPEILLLNEIPSYKVDGINEAGLILESINELVEDRKTKKLLAKLLLKKFSLAGDTRRLWLQAKLRKPEHLINMENVYSTISKWDNLINSQQYKARLLADNKIWDGRTPLEDHLLEVFNLAERAIEDDEPNESIFRFLALEGYLVRLPAPARQLVRNQISGREKLIGKKLSPDEIYNFITTSLANEIWLHTKNAGSKGASIHQLCSDQVDQPQLSPIIDSAVNDDCFELSSSQQRKNLFNTLSAKISANLNSKLDKSINNQMKLIKDEVLSTSQMVNSQSQQIHQLTNLALQNQNKVPAQLQNPSIQKPNQQRNNLISNQIKTIPMPKNQMSFADSQCIVHPNFIHTNKNCFSQMKKQFKEQNCIIHPNGNHTNSQCLLQTHTITIDDAKCDLHPNGFHTKSQCRMKQSVNTFKPKSNGFKPQPLFVNLNNQQNTNKSILKKRGGPLPGSKEERDYLNRCWRCGLPASLEAKQAMIAQGWIIPDTRPHIAKDCTLYNANDPIGFHVCRDCGSGFHTECKNKKQ